jgi:hypothetical protein
MGLGCAVYNPGQRLRDPNDKRILIMRNPLSPIALLAIMVISSLTSSAQTKQLSKAAHAASPDRVPDLSGSG